MTIRGFFERHRTATGVITPAALGVALLVALTWALWSAPPRTIETELTASTADCHDMVTLSIAGRGDTPRPGTTKMLVDANGRELPAASADDYVSTWIDQASSAPLKAVAPGSYAAMYIAYPADMSSYENSVNTGVANAESVIRAIRLSCPDTKFAIVGYSEGADVARRVAMNVGHQEADADGKYGLVDPANVVGVVIVADAGRDAGQGPFPGAQNPFSNPDGFDLKYQNGKKPVPGQGVTPDTGGSDFGALAGRVASFCSDGDLTCAAPQNISLLQLVVNVGRQLNIDALEREQLTPATGMDVATVLSRIALNAFAEINSQPDWMQGDQTFLQVLLQVSDPSYQGPSTTTPTTTPTTPPTTTESGTTPGSGETDSISTDKMSPLAYLPQKLFKEIVGLIVTNQNTIPVIMSDPYQLTLARDVGHHFDYWRDADPANGKPLTSADYAAAWLTHLAKQAQAGQQVNPSAKLTATELSAALSEVTASSADPSSASAAPSDGSSAQPTADAAAGTSGPTETVSPAPAPPTTEPEAATSETPETTDTPVAPQTTAPQADSSVPAARTTTAAPTTTPTTTVTSAPSR